MDWRGSRGNGSVTPRSTGWWSVTVLVAVKLLSWPQQCKQFCFGDCLDHTSQVESQLHYCLRANCLHFDCHHVRPGHAQTAAERFAVLAPSYEKSRCGIASRTFGVKLIKGKRRVQAKWVDRDESQSTVASTCRSCRRWCCENLPLKPFTQWFTHRPSNRESWWQNKIFGGRNTTLVGTSEAFVWKISVLQGSCTEPKRQPEAKSETSFG